MRKSGFSEEQIVQILKEGEAGKSISEVCRKRGAADVTYYRWRAKYAGMEVPELKRMKVLEEENSKLKSLLADSMLTLAEAQQVIDRWRDNYNRVRPHSSLGNRTPS